MIRYLSDIMSVKVRSYLFGEKSFSRLWIYLGTIRVKAPVTWRPPHRSGREDFPHPVPQNTQALCLCITRQISLRLAHNSAAQLVISDAVSASEAMGTSYS